MNTIIASICHCDYCHSSTLIQCCKKTSDVVLNIAKILLCIFWVFSHINIIYQSASEENLHWPTVQFGCSNIISTKVEWCHHNGDVITKDNWSTQEPFWSHDLFGSWRALWFLMVSNHHRYVREKFSKETEEKNWLDNNDKTMVRNYLTIERSRFWNGPHHLQTWNCLMNITYQEITKKDQNWKTWHQKNSPL